MTSPNKKTQSTSQCSNENLTEIEELKQEISDLRTKCKELSQLTQDNNYNLLQSKIDKLIDKLEYENTQLRLTNEILQLQIDNYEFMQSLDANIASHDEAESNDLIIPAKRQMRKKPSEEEEKAKVLVRTLLKTFPSELNLKDEETFKSKTNDEICQKLIPRLQKEMKAYNPTYEQVESWLLSIHRSKRAAYLNYLKSNQLNQPNPTSLDNEQEAESDGSIRPAKRQKKSKETRPTNLSEDEDALKIEGGVKTSKGLKPSNLPEDEDVVKIDEGAKILMKTLLKTFPPELNLRDEETFKSKTNVEICQKLIPRLQKEVKAAYNLSYEQIETWLQSFHRSKRNFYLKSHQLNQTNPTSLDNEQEAESDVNIRPAKRQKKSKEKRPTNFSEDEDALKIEEGAKILKGRKSSNLPEDEDALKIEEGAKSLMKALLKTYPYEYTLSIEDTFRSQVNIDICDRLIPKLQRDVKSAYDLSYGQVETWLHSFHKSRRNAHLKSNQSNNLSPTSFDNEFDNLQEAEFDDSIRLAIRQTKSKDELKNEEGVKIEEGAKSLMKRLIDKTYTQNDGVLVTFYLHVKKKKWKLINIKLTILNISFSS
ncbi:hypothetical protein GLOIN_2v1667513 [Rhizophagus clarus]|uniref:Uncharacterized protein n=1 Tax=Rhizophagus clarus TaxID=94130 RepID=A0A8H3QDV0_9GLOM|nr:hypothetical protein GLOIN_2v1667513 [Rhizophagus clarus]